MSFHQHFTLKLWCGLSLVLGVLGLSWLDARVTAQRPASFPNAASPLSAKHFPQVFVDTAHVRTGEPTSFFTRPALTLPGDLDPTFNSTGKVYLGFGASQDSGKAVVIQPDGKIVVAGIGPSNIRSGFVLVRYNSDGSLDPSFDGDGKLHTIFEVTSAVHATALVLQPDGKLVVAGNGPTFFAMARYNSDGSLDLSFDDDGKLTTNIGTSAFVKALVLQPNGKLVVAGHSHNGLNSDFTLVRYNSDGNLDTSFDGDGKLTTDFGSSYDIANALVLQPDGKLVAAGHSDTGLSPDIALARYNSDGSLDSSFDGDGKLTTSFGSSYDAANALVRQPDGKLVAAGISGGYFALARYNSDGSLDPSFDGDGKQTTNFGSLYHVVNALVRQPDGKLVAAGIFGGDVALARYNSDGSLDSSFDGDGKLITDFGSSTEAANAVALQSDGKLLVAGFSTINSSDDFALARYNSNGSLDPSFDGDGKLFTDVGNELAAIVASVLQLDGKLVVVGSRYKSGTGFYSRDFVIARYNSDGSLDPSFDGDGKLIGDNSIINYLAAAVQPDGKLVVAGYGGSDITSNFLVARYNSDGSPDTSFDGDGIIAFGSGRAEDVVLQPDGKIVVAGSRYTFLVVARFNNDGSFDTSFDGDGELTTDMGATAFATAMALQLDGKLVVAGYIGLNSDVALARYNSNGSLDTSFDGDGKLTTDFGSTRDTATALALQPDGKLVVAGYTGTSRDVALARYNSDGSLDPSFDGDGKLITDFGSSNDAAHAVALQPDGKLLVAGTGANNSNRDFVVARYDANGLLDSSWGFGAMRLR